ncbi:MAG: hypothetical protein ABSC73_04405 [Acidimicrobiales bacterium]|jgi:hypothetical protein
MRKHWPALSISLVSALVLPLLVAGSGSGNAAASSFGAHKTAGAGDEVALTVPAKGSGGFNLTKGSYLEGFEFTATRPISISKLGAYDSNLSKLRNGSEKFATVQVAVFDLTAKRRLCEASVGHAEPALGVFRYATLSRPVTLNTTHRFAVVWVSLSNHYLANPELAFSDVNPAIHYLATAGLGAGGRRMTRTLVEPNWFFTVRVHGLAAINHDVGPNFIFTTPR